MPEKIPQEVIEESVVKYVTEAKKHFTEQRKTANYEKEWLAAEKSYFNDTDDFYNGLAKIRVPALHQAVETLVPKYDRSLFPVDGNWFDAEPENPEDEVQVMNAYLASKFLKKQMIDIKSRAKIIGIIRSICTYGTVFVKTYWEHKIKERYKRVNGKREKVWETVFDNPNFYSPSIWDIYADIKDEDLEGIVIERIVKDYEDLYSNRERTEDGQDVGIYTNVEQLKDNKNPSLTDKPDNKAKSESISGLKEHEYGDHELKVEVLECWGQIPKWFLTGDQEDKENHLFVDGLLVVGIKSDDSGVALRISENPFDNQEIPYIRGRYIKIDGRLYGLGVMSVNISLEMELNTLRSQAMDCRTFNLKPKWLKDINAQIDDEALKDLGNQIVETQDINGLQPLRPNDFTSTVLATENIIKQDIQDATGASKLLGGTSGGNSLERTALGLTTVVQSGLDRLELAVTLFEEEVIKPTMKKMWDYNQQFLPEGREIPVLGQQMIRINPAEMNMPNIRFNAIRELASKEFKTNGLNTLLQNLSPYIPLGIDPLPVLFAQLKLMGQGDLIPQIDKRPNSDEQLEATPEGEVQLLQMGRKVKIDFNDDHEAFIQAYEQLLSQPNLNTIVQQNTKEALGQRLVALKLKNNPNMIKEIIQSDGTIEQKAD